MPSHTVSRPVSRVPSRRPTEFSQWGPLVELFAHGEDGFLFGDWSELDELFTTSTGPTAVAADSDPVGLALDDRAWGVRTRAQQLAVASELVTNGGFDTDASGWTGRSGASLSSVGGVGRVTNTSAAFGYGSQSFSVTIGRTYRISVSGLSSLATLNLGNTESGGQYLGDTNINGTTRVVYVVATGSTLYIALKIGGNTIGQSADFDDVSCKLVDGNHALQATTTQRPLWRANSGKPYLSFDGSDDRLVTPFVPSTALTLAVAFNSATGNAALTGGGDSAGSRRAFIGLNSLGYLGGGWGAHSFANIVATVGVDIRSQDHVGILVADASTVDLYLDGVLVYTGAASGSASGTTSPVALGCLNNGGTPASFSAMRGYAALALNRRATPAEIALITRQLQRTYQ